jgi:hypothetical protein
MAWRMAEVMHMFGDETHLIFPSCGSIDMPLIFEPQLLRCQASGPGGHPLTVLFDTGTDPSAIDLGLARRLGLPLGAFAYGQDALSNTVPFAETRVPWLRLGDLQVRNLFALALDLSPAPFQVDIVLGYNVLWQVVLHVDYVRRRLRLSHPDLGTTLAPDPDIILPLTFAEHFPTLMNVTLCENIHLPLVTIDTGSNGGLTLGPDLAARLGLRRGSTAVQQAQGSGFAHNGCEVVCGHADSMQMGPLALYDIELDSPGSGTGSLQQAGRANIGNRLLSRFPSMTLDYERKVCILSGATQREQRR